MNNINNINNLVRIFNLCKKDGKLNRIHLKQIQDFIKVLDGEEEVRAYTKWYGYGTEKTYPNRKCWLFKSWTEVLGLKIEWLNDAPRHGKVGDFFIVVNNETCKVVKERLVRLINE